MHFLLHVFLAESFWIFEASALASFVLTCVALRKRHVEADAY